MRNGTTLVEQVDKNGNFVKGYDSILSRSEIFEQLQDCFPGIEKKSYGYIGVYKDLKFSIKIKNINYLGNPHPINKKRIQIAADLQDFYNQSKKDGYYPILLGLYSFQENYIFIDFHIEDYVRKNSHNSSAHVLTEDLAETVTHRIFQKFDANLNKITLFQKDSSSEYFDSLIEFIKESAADEEILNSI